MVKENGQTVGFRFGVGKDLGGGGELLESCHCPLLDIGPLICFAIRGFLRSYRNNMRKEDPMLHEPVIDMLFIFPSTPLSTHL